MRGVRLTLGHRNRVLWGIVAVPITQVTADTQIFVTFFDDWGARHKIEKVMSLDELADLIRATNSNGADAKAAKAVLPWLKLAEFGPLPTEHNCLRWDGNVRKITGAEGDYDIEVTSFAEAVEIAEKAGLGCLLYTSPSHHPERPRWRVLAPTSTPLEPAQREHLVSRLNGLFHGTLASESWNLSQSYYYGSTNNNPDHQVIIVEGEPIDRLDELDEIAINRPPRVAPGPAHPQRTGDGTHKPSPFGPSADDMLDVTAALALINNPEEKDWERWNYIALAVWAATEDSYAGLAAFMAWSAKAGENVFDAAETERRWNDITRHPPAGNIGAGTLFMLARQAWPGFEKPSDLRRRRDNDPGEPPPYGDEPGPTNDPPPHRKDDPPGPRRYRFPLVRFKDIKLSTAPRWIVEDMIPRDGLVLMWGKPKCGKSFVAFDLGLHIALGWDYCGKRVEQGPVVYIAAEGALGLSARAEAFRQAKLGETDDADPPFHLLASRLDLVGQLDELVADTAAQLAESDGKCSVIFLDTVNRTFRGSESRDEDMGNYLRAADRLREVFGCTVVLIHHCGYDDTRPRGHTSLIGALDAEISIKRDDDNTILAKLELMKDGAAGDMLRFVLKPIDIGEDDYGKVLTSCFVEPLDVPSTPRERKRKLSPTNQRALDLLHEAINTAGATPPASNHIPPGRACVRETLWRDYCYKGGLSDGACDSAQRKAFKRAWNELLAIKRVATWDGWVWPG